MTSSNPRIQKRPASLNRSTWSAMALIDQGFFIFAGVASVWLAYSVFREAVNFGGWWILILFLLCWLVSAYLALPRIHRILSHIYVPNYFIGRARTADGLLGDPVNLAFRGSEANLHQVMTDAGWHLADEITISSAWKMVKSSLRSRSYVNAPVSSLFLFGRRHDFCYQMEVDNSPQKRHHVRFWRCPKGWMLPGGYKVDWLASGTYDRSIGLSLFTFQITHKIDENIDIERDYIAKTALQASKRVKIDEIKDFSTGYHSRNGGGDSVKTDGSLYILEVGGKLKNDKSIVHSGLVLDRTNQLFKGDLESALYQLWSKRPPQIVFGSMLVLMTMAISILVLSLSGYWQSGIDSWLIVESTTLILLIMAVELFLAGRVLSGSEFARAGVLAISSFYILGEAFNVSYGKASLAVIGPLVLVGIHIVIILLFSSDGARQFTWANSAIRERGN